MNTKYKYLFKNFLLFGLGNFLPKILTFLMVPLYTACLSTLDYGIADFITTTISLLLPILTINIQDAVLRYSLDKNYRKEEVFSAALIIVFRGMLILLFCLFLCKLFSVPLPILDNAGYFLLMYISHAIYNCITMFCRGTDKVYAIVGASVVNTFTTVILNLVLLLVFKMGLEGYLLANTIGSIGAILYCVVIGKVYKYIKIKTDSNILKEMCIYSFPLIGNSIAWWVNSASDKYILIWLSGLSTSGIYAISSKIPGILSILQSVFYQAWSISVIKEFDKNDKDDFFGKSYNMLNLCLMISCSVLICICKPLAKLLYSNEFFEAWKYTPLLLIAVVFNSMALFIGSIFTAVKDTKIISLTTIIGAIVNTICNIILIYLFGAWGAAMATVLGYITTFVMRHILVRKYIMMEVHHIRDMICYCLLMGQSFTYVFLTQSVAINAIYVLVIIAFYSRELFKLSKRI